MKEDSRVKHPLPSLKTVFLCIVTAGLVLSSLPQGGTDSSVQQTHLPSRFTRPAHAIPTMAAFDTQSSNERMAIGNTITSDPKVAQHGAAQSAPNASQPPVWKMLPLRIRVIDGRSMQPISGAEVVLIETEHRETTGTDGVTPWFQAPYIRSERFRPLVSELHGQLGVIVYKNGYRDSVHLGIRIHPGIAAETTVWMYKLGPGDSRVEPVFYEVPYHHLYLIELAQRFRSKSQPGAGPERP